MPRYLEHVEPVFKVHAQSFQEFWRCQAWGNICLTYARPCLTPNIQFSQELWPCYGCPFRLMGCHTKSLRRRQTCAEHRSNICMLMFNTSETPRMTVQWMLNMVEHRGHYTSDTPGMPVVDVHHRSDICSPMFNHSAMPGMTVQWTSNMVEHMLAIGIPHPMNVYILYITWSIYLWNEVMQYCFQSAWASRAPLAPFIQL